MSSLLHSAVTIMTPLLFAAMGGLFTEQAGMLNIALEGLLLSSAFAAASAAYFTGSILTGTLAGIAAALFLAALTGAVILKLKTNVFITGLAANLFAQGITVVLSYRIFGTRGAVTVPGLPHIKTVSLPLVENIPLLGPLISGHTVYVYLAWIFLFAAWVVLFKTPFGFRLRAASSPALALESLGLKPSRYQFAAFLISGIACGTGGSILALNLGVFVPNISAGRGWIALVIIFLGNRKPQGLLAAALIFGLAESISNHAQGILNIPTDFILAIPYCFTLIGMIGVSIWTRRKNQVM